MAKKTNSKKTTKSETITETKKIVNETPQDAIKEDNEDVVEEEITTTESVIEESVENIQKETVEANNTESIKEANAEDVTVVTDKDKKEEKTNKPMPRKQITTMEMFGYQWLGQIYDY